MSPISSSAAPAIPLKEFDHEMESTRKLLERVPAEQGAFKPHEKSFPLAHLAQLVSWIPGWITQTLKQDEINLAGSAGYSLDKANELLSTFDRNAREARAALEQVTGDVLDESWSLKAGDKVLMTLPRGEAVRGHLNHLIHHRGQLTVYVRMVGKPLPQIYGPTADEPWAK